MTRYLPIRKEEFDLRSHIESSGHSVETCYHVILTEKMCKGYLVKMGGKIKSWKKRWFVFDRLKRTFSYYVGKSRGVCCVSVALFVCLSQFNTCQMNRRRGPLQQRSPTCFTSVGLCLTVFSCTGL